MFCAHANTESNWQLPFFTPTVTFDTSPLSAHLSPITSNK